MPALAAYPLPSTPPVSSREWPLLTLYRDGLTNLNGLATELLRTAASVALVAPPLTKPGRPAKAWQLHTEGPLALIPHGSRVGARFRALSAAQQLFATQPATTKALTFALTPEPRRADCFRLLPL